jgi:hypothetical protein
MNEQQRNLTLGQFSDIKRKLEETIKNQITDFVKQTGCSYAEVNANCRVTKRITNNDTVENEYDNSSYVTVGVFSDNLY